MNLEQVNKWLTLVANFGVIGGLVLVAMQMNFNAETIRQQNDIELYRGFAAGELAFMGDSTASAWAAALFHPAELTEVQIGQVWAYLHNALLAAQNNWLSYRDGMASEESWARARALAASYISFRVGRIWWKNDKFEFEQHFVEQVDAELANMGAMDVSQITQQMLDEVHNLDGNAAKRPLRDGPPLTPGPSAP